MAPPDGDSVKYFYEEALEVTAALRAQGILQGHVIFLQVHVLDGLQIHLEVNVKVEKTM